MYLENFSEIFNELTRLGYDVESGYLPNISFGKKSIFVFHPVEKNVLCHLTMTLEEYLDELKSSKNIKHLENSILELFEEVENAEKTKTNYL